MWEDIQKMLAASPIPDAEEHAIHDYEGFEGARISEYTGIETVAKLTAFITEHGINRSVLSHLFLNRTAIYSTQYLHR